MAKSPRKKPERPNRPHDGPKSPNKERSRGRKTPVPQERLISSPEFDLRTLVLLSMGDWSELADLEWPPDNIRRWLEKADIRHVRGMLLVTLHRWHELRRGDE